MFLCNVLDLYVSGFFFFVEFLTIIFTICAYFVSSYYYLLPFRETFSLFCSVSYLHFGNSTYYISRQASVIGNNTICHCNGKYKHFSAKIIFNLLKYEMLKVHSDRKYITFYCIITYVNTTGYLIKSLQIKNVNDK